MVKPCPYCEGVYEGAKRVRVMDKPRLANSPETTTIGYTDCIEYVGCGHLFPANAVDDVLTEFRELRRLEKERDKTESASRVEELNYEIKAQENAVRNRRNEMVCSRIELGETF